MLTTRWEPMVEMNRLRNELDRVFGRYGSQTHAGPGVFPPLNLWEDEDNVYLEAELPGFELGDLEIYVTGGDQLSMKGERKPLDLEEGVWRRRERGFGSFSRVVELPCGVESEKVSAELKQGVLTVTLPKSEDVKPRRIEVKAG